MEDLGKKELHSAQSQTRKKLANFYGLPSFALGRKVSQRLALYLSYNSIFFVALEMKILEL